jgi:hypothetical protein
MDAVDDLDEVLERFKLAGNEFMKGDPKPVQELFSHREDVSLANPFGPPVRVGAGRRETGARRIELPRWRDLRLRDRNEVRNTRVGLRLLGRADQREGRRQGRDHPLRS